MRIYTLVIDHRHGTSIYNFLSESEMHAALYAYVRENWTDEEDIDELLREEAIERYFHQDLWAEDSYLTEYTDFQVLSDLLISLKDTHAAALKLAAECDPGQLGLWDVVFTPAKEIIAKLERGGG
jgi:hypothetical protein